MSRILVFILIFVLFYQLSRMFINLFKAPQDDKNRTTARQSESKVRNDTSKKGYSGGEYIDYEEVD